jgi:hypothetical protein
MAFRSAYWPVKDVVDGDLASQFPTVGGQAEGGWLWGGRTVDHAALGEIQTRQTASWPHLSKPALSGKVWAWSHIATEATCEQFPSHSWLFVCRSPPPSRR